MSEFNLKRVVGLTLISFHFVVFAEIIYYYLKGAFSFNQISDMISIIVPMFAGYSTSVVSFIIANRYKKRRTRSKRISRDYVALSLLFPTAFFILIFGSVWFQSKNEVFSSFEEFKQALFLLESVFAVYVGRFVYSMFEEAKADSG